MIRSRGILGIALVLVLSLVMAACGSDPTPTPKPAPAPAGAAAPTATPVPTAFDLLVQRAKASSHVVRGGLGFHPDTTVKALEEGFEKRFGFPLKLENEPGHPARDMPTKILTAGSTKTGVLDWGPTGTTVLAFPLLEKGMLREPKWDTLAIEWPDIQNLRKEMPDWTSDKLPPGKTLQDYCALRGHSTWVMNYNPRTVKPEEVANLKYDDLIGPKWKDRVVMDERALGLYQFPLAPGWSEQRLKDWAHNLGANGMKIFPGGSRGVHQAILQGEGDIGLGSPAWTQVQAGQPIDFTVAEFTTGANPSLSCLPKWGVNNPDMAELFYGWEKMEGNIYAAKPPANYTHANMLAKYANDYPLSAKLAEAGLTVEKLVFPRNLAENKASAGWRKVAMDAQKSGIKSGKPVPYNYK